MNKGWPWILVAVLLALLGLQTYRLRQCEAARASDAARFTESEGRVADLEGRLKETEAKLAECLRRCPPPDEIPIIIDPASGGNAFNIDGGTAKPTFSGIELSRLAFGGLKTFKGFVHSGNSTITANLKRVTGTFSGKVLEISTTGGSDPQFVWKLDGQTMTSKEIASNQDWNAALCAPLSGGLAVRYVDPANGQEKDGTAARIEIVVNVP